MQLVKYDAMCSAIAVCHSVDEVKEIRDKAIALEAYAKQALNMESERKACEIRLRAERRAGELLKEKQRASHSRGNQYMAKVQHGPQPSDYQQAKQSANISDTQAKRWQKLASVPENDFEKALEDPEKPSTTGIIRKANGSSGKMDDSALWLWGRLRDFERLEIDSVDIEFLISEMTDTMISDMRRIVPVMRDYLDEMEKLL